MSSDSVWTKLHSQWSSFLGLVLEPITFLFIAGLGALYWYSTTEPSGEAPALIYVLLTVTSAIIGGRITMKWMELSEGSIVAARGKSAVRSLKLQLRSIAALEKTVRDYRKAEDEISEQPDVVKRNYEEAIRTCQSLQEQTVSAIENWTDIVPEADIKSQIGELTELKLAIDGKENELDELKSAFEDTEGKSKKEKQALKKQIAISESQIAKLEKEVWDAKYNLSGLSANPFIELGDSQILAGSALKQGDLIVGHQYTDVSGGETIGELLAGIASEDDQKKGK